MRVRVLLGLAALTVAGCTADAPGPMTDSTSRWITSRQGCGVWDPQPQPGEVVDWTGACMGGFTEGPGTLTWRSPHLLADGTPTALVTTQTYEGDMRHGKDDGNGVLADVDLETGRNRYVVTGHFVDDQPEGRAAVAASDGYRFEGIYRNGRRAGPGLARYGNGAAYDGMFGDGLPDGHGVLTGQASIRFPPGLADAGHAVAAPGAWRFDGAFAHGVPQGRGTLVLPGPASPVQPGWTLDGAWIEGCLSDGTRQACIGPGRDRAPELAVLPVSHRAIAKRWAVRPFFPADAVRRGLTGKVTLECYVMASGVAESCDVSETTDHHFDQAAITMATGVPWIPASTPDGAPIDDSHVAYAVTFGIGAPPVR